MKTLFLTSQACVVISHISKKINIKNLTLAFITTASEVSEGDLKWLDDDRNSLKKCGFKVTDYTITNKTQNQIKKDLKNFDVIYISGGNTFYLLEKIQQTNSKDVFRDLIIKQEKIYIGSSAGSVIAGPDIYPVYRLDRAEKASELKDYKGLGLVDFVVMPHWGLEKYKDLYLNQRLGHAYNMNNKIILLNDNQYVYVKDDWYCIEEIK